MPLLPDSAKLATRQKIQAWNEKSKRKIKNLNFNKLYL